MARDAPLADGALWCNRTAEYRAAVDRACAMQEVPPVRLQRGDGWVSSQTGDDSFADARPPPSFSLSRTHARTSHNTGRRPRDEAGDDAGAPEGRADALCAGRHQHGASSFRVSSSGVRRGARDANADGGRIGAHFVRPPPPPLDTHTTSTRRQRTIQRTAIEDLDRFVRANKREYTAPPDAAPRAGGGAAGAAAAAAASSSGAGGLSSAERDRVEAEVGAVVKTCAAQIEQLKASVLAAQKEQQAARRRMMAGGGGARMARRLGAKDSAAATANEETIAHLHGVVLALADRLGEVSASFDRCRAARHSAAAAAAEAYGGGAGGGGGGFGIGGGAGAGASGAGRGGAATGAGRPPSARAAEAAQRYSNLAAAQAAAQAWDGGGVANDDSGAGGGGGGRGGSGGGGSVAATGAALQRQQQQQQQLLESESAALIAQLTSRRTRVRDVERSMREVAQLGGMLSTAVQGQQQQIELLYEEAVAATRSLRLGNAELRKTVRVGRSTRSYVLALLLTASVLLLLFDRLA